MNKILITVLTVLSAAVTAESLAASNDGITQVFTELDRCLSSSDAKCVGELMVEDATFASATSGTKIIKGNAQIVKFLEDLMGLPAPDMKGAKQTHVVKNVRMIGADHAVVDASVDVAGMKSVEGVAADARGSYHAVAVMVLKGSTWLFEDLRSYAVGPAEKAAPPAAKAAPPAEKAASPAEKAAPPAEKAAPPAEH